jgi:outer membrane lipoprotein-sorting protein
MIILGVCIALFVSACASPAATKANPKEVVTNAYQKLSSLKSYHLTMDVVSSFTVKDKNVSMVMKSEMDIQQKPIMYKNLLNITTDMGGKKIEQKVTQYAEEADNQLMVYSNIDNQWVKQAMDKAEYDPMKDMDGYIKGISSVTPKAEDSEAVTYEIVLGENYVKERLQKTLGTMGMKNVQLTDEMVKSLGDFKYTVKIDKKTATISKIEFDLTGIMVKLGEVLAQDQNVPEDQKQALKEIFKSMKSSTSMTLSQFDSVANITVPAEAKQ